jgi:hypothetical protein
MIEILKDILDVTRGTANSDAVSRVINDYYRNLCFR